MFYEFWGIIPIQTRDITLGIHQNSFYTHLRKALSLLEKKKVLDEL